PQSPLVEVEADYLLWKVRSGPLPFPLLTTGGASDAIPGGLGQQGTRVLFGGSPADFDIQSGARLSLGVRADRASPWAIQSGGSLLARPGSIFSAASSPSANPVLPSSFPTLDAPPVVFAAPLSRPTIPPKGRVADVTRRACSATRPTRAAICSSTV